MNSSTDNPAALQPDRAVKSPPSALQCLPTIKNNTVIELRSGFIFQDKKPQVYVYDY
jgi:hypothetical protein